MTAETNRWWSVFSSVLGLFVGNGPIMEFTFGVLLPPISNGFGWARGTVSSVSPLVFTALYAVMGLTAAGQTPLVYAKAISARFDDERGLALGIAMAGVGLGAAGTRPSPEVLDQSFNQSSAGSNWRCSGPPSL